MISTSKEPKENNIACVMPDKIEICMAATFKVPNGSEPTKLTSIPTKNIRMIAGISDENTK